MEKMVLSIDRLSVINDSSRGFKVYIERFESDTGNIVDLSMMQSVFEIDVDSSFEIEGWVECAPLESFLILRNRFGDVEVTKVIDKSPLASRSDLPHDGRYFNLVVPITGLVRFNSFVLEVHTSSQIYDVFEFDLSVASETSGAGLSSLKLISIVSGGRSGSTYLTKLLSKIPVLYSPSTEECEHTFMHSALKYHFSAYALRAFTFGSANDGVVDSFFGLPYISEHSPVRHLYDRNYIEKLFDTMLFASRRYYSSLSNTNVHEKIIVEKGWLNPECALDSGRLGIFFLILIRHPVSLANSIKSYNLRRGFGIGIDFSDSEQLIRYVKKMTSGLLWYARFLPNSMIIRYEDLVSRPQVALGDFLRSIGVESVQAQAWSEGACAFDLTATQLHQSTEIIITPDEIAKIESSCKEYVDYFYPAV
jgi:hypothetical protein